MAEDRADPFADSLNLSDFMPSTQKRPAAIREAIREVSEAVGFPSRAPALKLPRRRRTGRNAQLNLKVTQATIDRFTMLADADGLVFGELLEKALDAYQKSRQ